MAIQVPHEAASLPAAGAPPRPPGPLVAPPLTADAPLAWGAILAWSVGTVGPVTLLYLVTSAYLFFMTDLMKVSGAVAGLLLFIVRIYDMFADPVMGHVSDRTRSPMGRRRPWMLAGAVTTVGGCVAMFTVPGVIAAGGGGALVGWSLAALFVYFTGYTMFNVPYMAMPAEMTDGFHDRTRLMSARVVFVSLSSLLGAALAPRLIDAFGGSVRGYEVAAWVIGGIGLATMLACVATTAGVRATAATPVAAPLLSQLRVALSNRPFVVLILTKLLLLLSMSAQTSTMFFFVRHLLHQPLSVASNIAVAQTLGMLAALPLWVRLARRWEKPRLFMVASGANAAILLSWLLVSAGDPQSLLLLRALLLGAFAGGSLLMGQSMLPDTMEFDYRRSGLRREGAFSGVYSMVEKAGFAFGPLLVGGMLSAAGYQPGAATGQQIELSDSVTLAVYLGVAVIPAIATGLCVLVLRGYTLTEAALKAMTPPAAPRP